MRRIVVRILTPVILSTSIVAIVGTPAFANNCTDWSGPKGSTYTDVFNNGGCYAVEARIDRYYSSKVYVHTSGPWRNFAEVVATEGTNAGNAGRGSDSSSNWPGWIWF